MSAENVLITGASSGLGEGLARRFAERGAQVYAAARRKDRLEELASVCSSCRGRVVPLTLDVGAPEDVVSAVRRLDEDCGGLDVVIANAGVGRIRAGADLEWEDVAPILQTNVVGAIATLTAALPGMVRRGSGCLVGISSLAGFRGLPSNAAYSASKAALSTFLESLRVDLHGTGVKVTSVHPGFIKTPMTADNESYMPFLMESEEAVEAILKGLDNGWAAVEFPWALAQLVRAIRLMPDGAYRAMARRAIKYRTKADPSSTT